MLSVTTLPILQAVNENKQFYFGLQSDLSGRADAQYVNRNISFNPASNTININVSVTLPQNTLNGYSILDNSIPASKILTNKEAFANFHYSSNVSVVEGGGATVTIANNATYGAQMPFNSIWVSKNITGNAISNTWTHSLTGHYVLTVTFRQNSGGDLWSVLAVTKNGPNTAVGISARCGSGDSRETNYTLMYKVDDTSSFYQLRQWTQVSSKTVSNGFFGTPGWTNSDQLNNYGNGFLGRMVDIIIRRIGDL